MEYSTYLGGRGDDSINDITQDILGNLYLTGWTGSDNFPLTPGAYDSSLSGVDAFVMKFSIPKGVLYSSYLGGIEADQGTVWRLTGTRTSMLQEKPGPQISR
ncbi:SBBP repeat-containing protein [Methanothermobacter thermautotrophicus]|uniref:SBBP repeat-containing protein n=1 Tax=Methanothermobacter thermautotrophicus TaxID=145262 RepID=UPI003D7F4BC2